MRLILDPEDQSSGDTTYTSHTNKDGGAESALPLASNVVGLVSHCGWDIRVCAGSGQEDTEIPDVGVAMESHDGKSNEAQDHVEDDDRATEMVLVAEPTGCEHDDCGQCVRRSNKTLRCAD